MISTININLFPSLKDKRHLLAFAFKKVNESKSYLHCFTSDVSGKKEKKENFKIAWDGVLCSQILFILQFSLKVKYKENYMSQLGIWRSIPDRPEHFHHRAVTDAISDVSSNSS